MTFLPIVERELRVVSRLAATYRNRSLTVAVVAFVALIMLAFGFFSPSPSRTGNSMFWFLSWLTLIFCLLEGPRKTADCLSEEKREGTLGLLFLTDLKGYDIILGKLVAVSLNSFYGLIAILPVLGLPLLLGGVLPGEFWRASLALANALFFSLSAGMLVSCWSRHQQRAVTGTFLLILLIAVVPLLIPGKAAAVFSPIHAFRAADALTFGRSPQRFWQSFGLTQAISWALLLWASLIAPNCWRDDKGIVPPITRRFRSQRRREIDRRKRAEMLAINPAFWLAMRESPGRRIILALFAGVAIVAAFLFIFYGEMGALPLLLGTYWLMNLAIKVIVGFQACRCFAEGRRSNALELILSTPLKVERIVQGQLMALKYFFLGPLLLILGIEFASLLGGCGFLVLNGQRDFSDGTEIFMLGAIVFVYLLSFILDVVSVVWAGMWFGLSCKNENQARTRTLLLAIVLPSFCSWLFCYGFPLAIGIPIFWIAWGGSKVRTEFRRYATQPHNSSEPENWVSTVRKSITPV